MDLIKSIEQMEEFDEILFDKAIEELDNKFELVLVGLEEMERLILLEDLKSNLKEFPALEELYNLSLEKLGIPANEVLSGSILAVIIAGIVLIIGWILSLILGLIKFGDNLSKQASNKIIKKNEKVVVTTVEEIDKLLEEIISENQSSRNIGAVSFIKDVLTSNEFSELTKLKSNFYKFFSMVIYLHKGNNDFAPEDIEKVIKTDLSINILGKVKSALSLNMEKNKQNLEQVISFSDKLGINVKEEINSILSRLPNDALFKELKDKKITSKNEDSVDLKFFFKPIDITFSGMTSEIKYETVSVINLGISDVEYIDNIYKTNSSSNTITTTFDIHIPAYDYSVEDKFKYLKERIYLKDKASIKKFRENFIKFNLELENVLKEAKKTFERLKNKDDETIRNELSKLVNNKSINIDQSRTVLKLIKHNMDNLGKLTSFEAMSQKVAFKGINELMIIVDIMEIIAKSKNNEEAKKRILKKIR